MQRTRWTVRSPESDHHRHDRQEARSSRDLDGTDHPVRAGARPEAPRWPLLQPVTEMPSRRPRNAAVERRLSRRRVAGGRRSRRGAGPAPPAGFDQRPASMVLLFTSSASSPARVTRSRSPTPACRGSPRSSASTGGSPAVRDPACRRPSSGPPRAVGRRLGALVRPAWRSCRHNVERVGLLRWSTSLCGGRRRRIIIAN